MRTPHSHRSIRSRQGFSLLELSIVTIILAIIAVMGLELMASFVTRRAYTTSQAQITTLDNAIRAFYKSTGRLPCPAVITNSVGVATGGTEDCTLVGAVISGGVPYITLGLPVIATIDAYGSKIKYFVTKDLTVAGSAASQFDNSLSIGRIEVRTGQLEQPCSAACEVTMDPNTTTGAAYALLSHGADQRGAYSRLGISLKACLPAPTTLYDARPDSQNCGGATSPVITPSVAGNTVLYENKFNSGTNEANYFDDLIVVHPKGDM